MISKVEAITNIHSRLDSAMCAVVLALNIPMSNEGRNSVVLIAFTFDAHISMAQCAVPRACQATLTENRRKKRSTSRSGRTSADG